MDASGDRAATRLAALRSSLDDVDRALFDAVAERARILEEVAALKAETGAPLFDRLREEEILEAKRAEGVTRGVDPNFIEDLFRLLIRESHRRQREHLLREPDPETRTVAIIGGGGQIGRFFQGVFEHAGHETLISDVDTALRPIEAAARADVVMVSVPIAATEEVIERVGPHVREGGLLMDVTSLKQGPVDAMLRSARCEVIGAHPMFGPGVEALNRQVVVLCPARAPRWHGWLRSLLERQGAEILETTPEEHDRAMSVIQVLRHFSTMAMGRTLAALGVDLENSLRFASPIYRLELMMTGRFFAQDPELYADIEMRNPHRAEVLEAFEGAVAESAAIVKEADRAAFICDFLEASGFFGDFKDQALRESAFLISKMIERM